MGFWQQPDIVRRGAALVLDGIGVLVLVAIIQGIVGSIFGVEMGLELWPPVGLALFFFPAWVIARVIYHTPFEGYLGWTPGKYALGLRVRPTSGERAPGLHAAFTRNAFRVVDGLLWGLVGAWIIRGRQDRTRLGDILAGTYVEDGPLPFAAVLEEARQQSSGPQEEEEEVAHQPPQQPQQPPDSPQEQQQQPTRPAQPVGGPGGQDTGQERSALERFCRNVTQEAREGRIDEAIGREDEIEAVVEVLTRRKTNNVVLTGGPGVGKTALAEELARKLVTGHVPPALTGKELLELKVSALEAGANTVGVLPDRLNRLIDEIKAEPDRYILFVDEMHTIMAAGAHSANPSGAADILKPALARGELRMIGATTEDEYRQIEKDPAMARRFEKVHVRPLTVKETVEVLRRTKAVQEEHYGLRVEETALEAAAKLSDRYITDQQLPAKALNVLETSCARVALRGRDTVTSDDVAAVVSRQTGVPLGGLSGDERDKVANLEATLHERMVGQEEAVRAVADAVRRKRSGFGAERPASFGFFGPTGSGKTELAKALAEVLFGDEDAMVRLDMSEYRNENDGWKLLGSASGYQGSEAGGTLTEPVRRKPYSVILLDEVEKAHPQVLDPLLQILDDGRVTDGKGRPVNYKNAVVILTSNLAADAVTNAWSAGRRLTEEEMAEELVRSGMRPELVQRVGKIAVFSPPTAADVQEIARRMLQKTAGVVKEEHGVEVGATDEAVALLAERGYDPANGLRPLRRVIEREIENRLSELLFGGAIGQGDAIEFAVTDGALVARPVSPAPEQARTADGSQEEEKRIAAASPLLEVLRRYGERHGLDVVLDESLLSRMAREERELPTTDGEGIEAVVERYVRRPLADLEAAGDLDGHGKVVLWYDEDEGTTEWYPDDGDDGESSPTEERRRAGEEAV